MFVCLFSCRKTCRILTPWPGIEPTTHCVGRQSLNHWPTYPFIYHQEASSLSQLSSEMAVALDVGSTEIHAVSPRTLSPTSSPTGVKPGSWENFFLVGLILAQFYPAKKIKWEPGSQLWSYKQLQLPMAKYTFSHNHKPIMELHHSFPTNLRFWKEA